VSQSLYLDAATCFVHLSRSDDAVRVLQEALNEFAASAPSPWLEQCGDVAQQLGPSGESLAIEAYEKASSRLIEQGWNGSP
jgi:hypothetical protein